MSKPVRSDSAQKRTLLARTWLYPRSFIAFPICVAETLTLGGKRERICVDDRNSGSSSLWEFLCNAFRCSTQSIVSAHAMLCLPRCNALRFCIKESVCITLFVYILVYILLLSGKNHEASQKQDFPGQPICLVYIWAILGEKCRIKLKMGNNNHIWLVYSH